MNDLVLHPNTKEAVGRFVSAPSHALIVTGPLGSGKLSLAEHLATAVLGLKSLDGYPYLLRIEPEINKTSISIEAVRQLEHFLSLKVPAQSAYNRLVIIEQAHLMTMEAQNALLKLLEEPPAGTLITLTSANQQALLPTIRSRSQTLNITKPGQDSLTAYFKSLGYAEADIKQAYAISGGLPGLMSSLLGDDSHPLKQATDWARRLLSQTAYERLTSIEELARNKQLAADISFILQQMAHVSLQSATGPAAKRWQTVLRAGYQSSEALSQSVQPKLVLTDLMLNL